MVIVPDSKIKLIKNPLKLDNNNEMMFDNAEAQYNYFTSLPKLEFDYLTYVRKDGILRVETDDDLTFEDLLEYNFCMYQNTHFDNKWFYAFITDIKWVNPGLTEMTLQTAFYQTWQFDLTFMDSLIEREHVDDDGIGINTIEEGISTGEYIINSRQLIKFFDKTNYLPIIGVTELIDANGVTGIPDVYEVHGRIMNGVRYVTGENVTNISTMLRAYDALGKADAVQFMFMAPKELWGSSFHAVDVSFTHDGETYAFRYYKLDSFNYVAGGNQDILRPTNLDGYYPKNKKMFSFPYCYLSLDSHDGNIHQFNFEDFEYLNSYDDSVENRKIELDYNGILTPGCSIKYIPMKYKKGTGYLYSFPAMKTPMCSWVSDPYTNWLTQQAINTPFGTIDRKTGAGLVSTLGVLAGAGMLATGVGGVAGYGLIAGGFSGAFSNMQSDYQAQLHPNQAKGNVNSGDINFSLDLLNPEANVMSIKYDRAKCIDDFLSMYGYKVNRVGIPHLHVRAYYDYCKTNEANIEGNIPNEDLNEIRKMFNNGIRFWHNTQYYLNFEVDNSIITAPTPETTLIDTDITAIGVNPFKRSYINLLGNTSQTGTPSPDEPKEVKVVKGTNIIQISNANNTQQRFHVVNLRDLELCKIGDYQDEILKSTGKNLVQTLTKVGNSIYFNGSSSQEVTQFNPGTYTLSFIDSNTISIYIMNEDGTSSRVGTNSPVTFTTTQKFNMWMYRSGITVEEFSNVQLEKNDHVTEYEPYGTGWYIKKQIGKVVLNGSEDGWSIGGSSGHSLYLYSSLTNFVYVGNIPQLAYCNYFTSANVGSSNDVLGFFMLNSGVLRFREQTMKTLADWKTWLSTNNLILYYALATPQYTTITDTELNTQLNELYTASLFKGTNTITTITDNLKPYIKLHYNI